MIQKTAIQWYGLPNMIGYEAIALSTYQRSLFTCESIKRSSNCVLEDEYVWVHITVMGIIQPHLVTKYDIPSRQIIIMTLDLANVGLSTH